MVPLIPIIVVCCIAFFIISTSVACFYHHRSLNKPVRGIVLREDVAVTVTGRVIEVDQGAEGGQGAGAAVPSSAGNGRHGEGGSPRSDAFTARDDAATGLQNDGYVVQEVFNLSEEEQRRRELHNRRLNAEDARMACPMRADGSPHPLDGTPLAQVINFFRGLRSSHREAEPLGAEEAEGENAANPPTQRGGQAEDEAANADYGEYMVAINITLHEPFTRGSRRTEHPKTNGESTAATDPYGGMTKHDWTALNDASGIDYMTNRGAEYVPRTAEPHNALEDPQPRPT